MPTPDINPLDSSVSAASDRAGEQPYPETPQPTDFRDALSRLNKALGEQDEQLALAEAYRLAADEHWQKVQRARHDYGVAVECARQYDGTITELKAIVAAHLGPAADVPIIVRSKVENPYTPMTAAQIDRGEKPRKKRGRPATRWTPEVIEGARARYEAGEQAKKIAADIGTRPNNLQAALRRHGVPPRYTPQGRIRIAREARAQKRRSGSE